jgi:HAMP domain-containing protein
MTLIYPGQGDGPEGMLSEAHKNFERAVRALDSLVDELEAGRPDHASEAPKLYEHLRKALQTALQERERLAQASRDEAGIVNGYAIDFDAARFEIGRRLACLRDAGGEGSLPE